MIDENHGEITTCSNGPDDNGELDGQEMADDCWDAFLPDDDQRDPLPEPGDFWIGDDLLETRRSAA